MYIVESTDESIAGRIEGIAGSTALQIELQKVLDEILQCVLQRNWQKVLQRA